MNPTEQNTLGLPDPWPEPEEIVTRSGWKFRCTRVLVDSAEALAEMEREISASGVFTYDTETSGLKTSLGARIVGHSLAILADEHDVKAWYVPTRHIGAHNERASQIDPVVAAETIDRLIRGARCVGYHHAKFDWAMARADGIALPNTYVDTSILATIYDENARSFSLKNLAEAHMASDARFDQKALEDWMRADARKLKMPYRKSSRQKDIADDGEVDDEPTYLERFGFARTPIALCGAYACMDVVMTLYLWQTTFANVWRRYPEVTQREHDIQRILHEMEWEGLAVDIEEIRRAEHAARAEVAHWRARVRELSGIHDFTASDPELRRLFFDVLRLEPPKVTKGGVPAVDAEVRRLLAAQHPEHRDLMDALSHLARASKVHSTYVLPYLRHYSEETGRIHAVYNQLERRDQGGVPVTGRLSSSDPNVQNIDAKPLQLHSGAVLNARRYFIVPKGHVRAYVDFSQIELRVLTYFCRDPVLLHAYANDLDIHQQVAEQLGIDRKVAKQVNFGNSYGMTEIGLAKRLPGYYEDPDGTREFAATVLRDYFEKFSRILTFRADFAGQMKRNGRMFTNPLGRPRRIPTIASHQRWERERAERMMMSSIVSGTSADILKESLLRVRAVLLETGHGRIVQTIHDEIVIDFRKDVDWPATLARCVREMERWPMFEDVGVPIRASIELTGKTWADKRPIKLLPDDSYQWGE